MSLSCAPASQVTVTEWSEDKRDVFLQTMMRPSGISSLPHPCLRMPSLYPAKLHSNRETGAPSIRSRAGPPASLQAQ